MTEMPLSLIQIQMCIRDRSYEIFHNLLLEAPTQIIDEIRDLILTGQHQDDIDLKLLVSKNEEIYKNGLEQARKALKRFYDS